MHSFITFLHHSALLKHPYVGQLYPLFGAIKTPIYRVTFFHYLVLSKYQCMVQPFLVCPVSESTDLSCNLFSLFSSFKDLCVWCKFFFFFVHILSPKRCKVLHHLLQLPNCLLFLVQNSPKFLRVYRRITFLNFQSSILKEVNLKKEKKKLKIFKTRKIL